MDGSDNKVQAQKPDNWPPLVGLTVEEVAASLRVNVKTVRDAIKHGGLPARFVGKGWRIEEGALRAWIAAGDGKSRNAGEE